MYVVVVVIAKKGECSASNVRYDSERSEQTISLPNELIKDTRNNKASFEDYLLTYCTTRACYLGFQTKNESQSIGFVSERMMSYL